MLHLLTVHHLKYTNMFVRASVLPPVCVSYACSCVHIWTHTMTAWAEHPDTRKKHLCTGYRLMFFLTDSQEEKNIRTMEWKEESRFWPWNKTFKIFLEGEQQKPYIRLNDCIFLLSLVFIRVWLTNQSTVSPLNFISINILVSALTHCWLRRFLRNSSAIMLWPLGSHTEYIC